MPKNSKPLREVRAAYSSGDGASDIVLQALLDRGAIRSCLNCDNWRDDAQQCALYKEMPPAIVIVFGCESHLADVPF